jgi:hypothetical protein
MLLMLKSPSLRLKIGDPVFLVAQQGRQSVFVIGRARGYQLVKTYCRPPYTPQLGSNTLSGSGCLVFCKDFLTRPVLPSVVPQKHILVSNETHGRLHGTFIPLILEHWQQLPAVGRLHLSRDCVSFLTLFPVRDPNRSARVWSSQFLCSSLPKDRWPDGDMCGTFRTNSVQHFSHWLFLPHSTPPWEHVCFPKLTSRRVDLSTASEKSLYEEQSAHYIISNGKRKEEIIRGSLKQSALYLAMGHLKQVTRTNLMENQLCRCAWIELTDGVPHKARLEEKTLSAAEHELKQKSRGVRKVRRGLVRWHGTPSIQSPRSAVRSERGWVCWRIMTLMCPLSARLAI